MQYILVDTRFNYRCHFGLQEHVFGEVREIHHSYDLNKDMFLEVQNDTCS